MIDIREVADAADVIINGYAFTKCALGFRVLNLNAPEKAVVFSSNEEVMETTMDDIEISIVSDYLKKNRKYMED